MSNKSIEIPIEIVDRFSKTLKSLQRSLDELAIPAKVIASFLEIEKNANKAKEEINLFTLAIKAFIGLNAGVSILKAADTLEEFDRVTKFATKGAKLLRGAAAATGVAFGALIAIDVGKWLWDMFTASEQAARKVREEFQKTISTFTNTANSSKALIDQYFELRDKSFRTVSGCVSSLCHTDPQSFR